MSQRSEWILVTPELAERWLEKKAPNRALNDNLALEYALAMEAGSWEQTHQGIAFDDAGRLVDGQHRLSAIPLSKKSVKMLVTRGLTREEVLTIDRGRVRDAADSLSIFRGHHVTKQVVAISNRTMHSSGHYATKAGSTPGGYWRISTATLDEFIRLHDAALKRVTDIGAANRTVGVRSAFFGSILLRAFYHLSVARLSLLIDVLSTGHYEDPDKDSAGLLLRDNLISRTDGWRGLTLIDHYRVERAVLAFKKGERLSKIYPATTELFPLPEEKGTVTVPAVVRRVQASRREKGSTAANARYAKKFKQDAL